MSYKMILNKAEAILAEREESYGDAREMHESICRRWTGVLKEKLAPGASLTAYDVARMMAELKAARVEHQTNVTGLAQARLAVAAAKTALKEAEENAEAIARLELEVEVAGLLVEALGPNGFQAYEFAMAGPAVSALVNDLLQSCLGARFAVDVVTLRPKRSGGGFTEAFEFIVTDAEAGENRDIGQLSGGERAMVSEAIRVGLSLYASRRMAVKFETMMRDEPTSALSGENARAYVRMLRRAAEIGGFHQIFFVTHDRGASEIADGEIRVTNRGIEVLPCRGY